jgi:hypothetical protein
MFTDPNGLIAREIYNGLKESFPKIGQGLYVSATAWHFENRHALNTNLPSLDQATGEGSKWLELPRSMSIYHDNEVGCPERKFIHPDGREAVFDGDTSQHVTDPRSLSDFHLLV